MIHAGVAMTGLSGHRRTCSMGPTRPPIMLTSQPLAALLVIFVVSAVLVWVASSPLSDTTDILSTRLALGEALGGMVLLAVVEDLPEVTIAVSGALAHHLGLVTGNLLGGIAAQTLMLVFLDFVGVPTRPLSFRSQSLIIALEGLLGIAIFSVAILGSQLPSSLLVAHLTPDVLLIAVGWCIGAWLIGRSRTALPWQLVRIDDTVEPGVTRMRSREQARYNTRATRHVVVLFLLSSLAILVAGSVLEESSSALAGRLGLGSVFFGGTVLAVVTALPEFSAGLEAIRIGNYQTAFSEVFGSNAFLPVLFLPATLISGQAILPEATKSDIYLTGLGMLLTAIYLWGLIFVPRRQYFRLGADSIVVLLCYLFGIAGLLAIGPGH